MTKTITLKEKQMALRRLAEVKAEADEAMLLALLDPDYDAESIALLRDEYQEFMQKHSKTIEQIEEAVVKPTFEEWIAHIKAL